MNELVALDLSRDTLRMVLMLSAPMLLVALAVGLVVSIFQALTQINESTLAFVPKILGVFAALALAGPWLINTLLAFTIGLFNALPTLAR